MPLYMTQFAYTSDAWVALSKHPQNRAEAFRESVERMGGRFVSLYYSFGEYDGLAIFEAPDETTATAIVMSGILPGHLRTVKTTTLLTAEQTMAAMRKAGDLTPPGASGP